MTWRAENKYSRWYDALIEKARRRTLLEKPYDWHHVWPISFGGPKNGETVRVTLKEHRVAHNLLTKFVNGAIRKHVRPKRAWDPDRHHPFYVIFQMQRKNAEHRKIDWELTFTQWLDLWQRSGHWNERGRQKHQYCMGRIGDIGPYAVGNIVIITNEENRRMVRSCIHTEEFKRELSLRNIGNKYGKGQKSGFTHSSETLAKLSRIGLKNWAAGKFDHVDHTASAIKGWKTRKR